MKKLLSILGACVLICTLLSACGQKGALYLPPPDQGTSSPSGTP
ncbi:MAG: lipoprotein [Pseudomonadota bacterium]